MLHSGTPIVQVNRKIKELAADSVVSDNYKAAYTATQHLIERGRQHIVFLGYDPSTLSNSEKKEGYDAALKDHNIEDNLTIIVKEHNRQQIVDAFGQFLASNHPFDSLICTTQGKTAIALSLLEEGNFRIPKDVAVVGFDDTAWSSLLCTPLTAISEQTYQMGVKATTMLLERMRSIEATLPKHIILESEFIIRKST
jgi:DNA-binding LacI/PurR family transcriptional regulator